MDGENAHIAELIDRRDLLLVTGKGGTGKSTVVAALALLSARRRGRAVAAEVSANPRLAGLVGNGTVRSVNIDLEKAVAPALGRLTGMPAIAAAVVRNRALLSFIRTSPAVREMILLDELRDLVERSARERTPVVLDLPATGHALSFLDTPRAVRRMLRVGPLAQIARRAEELLLDRNRTGLVAVALPEELPVNETIELVRRARDMGLGSEVVVVNQVPVSPVHEGDHDLLDAVSEHGGLALERFAQTARDESRGAVRAREQVERLRASLPVRVVELPRYAAPEPAECARLVAEALAT